MRGSRHCPVSLYLAVAPGVRLPRPSGQLTEEEATQLWDALALLDVLTDQVGLDGWDYSPQPAEAHLVRALAQLGLLGLA